MKIDNHMLDYVEELEQDTEEVYYYKVSKTELEDYYELWCLANHHVTWEEWLEQFYPL